jgi:hypothetical protein
MTIDGVPAGVWDVCELPTVERPLRLEEFDQLFAESVLSWSRVSPTRMELTLRADAESAARDLAARESACCSFFSFEFDCDGVDLAMAIGTPLARADVLDALAARLGAKVDGRGVRYGG